MLEMKLNGSSKFVIGDNNETIVSNDIADMMEKASKKIKDNKMPDISTEETVNGQQ